MSRFVDLHRLRLDAERAVQDLAEAARLEHVLVEVRIADADPKASRRAIVVEVREDDRARPKDDRGN